ncbi:SMC family, C-terminal domain containing protein [Tritrichomonas foetus]|uniref:SMC family, C-terminal domain containing protein n=1 Tax=Tritrichomonas foetus TaxID=1144522 RepID=A0A1J4KVC0_9EUKA|nr:SMC family, C-terminal domain containing protein [Tritrichomonas foetus]|eukprot:OHT13646.1 SMC family, C-terminal domain containing protein [Tritrichomonas foetus]
MRIEQLSVKNFKSYKGTHTFGPFDDFSAVIGENGTGKSNCFDAICFVLGANAAAMRCQQLSNLIYNGRPKPKSASVTIEFSNVRNEGHRITLNSKNNVNSIKRKIVGASSIYYVNGEKRSYSEYKECLVNAGFPSKLQSFVIFQGDIQKIASMKPKDLTVMIEELSGSIKFKESYEKSESEFLNKQEEVSKLDSKRDELANKKHSMKKEAEEAKQWRELDSKLSSTEKELIEFQLNQSRIDLQIAEEKVSEMESDVSQKRKKLEEIEEALQMTEHTILTTQKCHKKQLKLQRKVQKELQEIKEENQALTAQKSEIEKQMNKHENELKTTKVQLDEETKNKSYLTKIVKSFQQKNKLFIDNKDKLKQIQDEIDSIDNSTEQRQILEEIELVSSKIENEKDNHLRYLNQIRFNDELIAKTDDELGKIVVVAKPISNKNETNREMKNLESKMNELNQKLNHLNILSRSNNRIETLCNLIHVLQQNIPNVFGFVRDLCRPVRAKFEKAIACALTYHMDEIIVKDLETAIKCIEMCKLKNLGTCTFLPLDFLRYKKSQIIRDDKVKPLIEMIEFDERDLHAIEYVTNGLYFCENPKIAKEKYLTKKWKRIVDKYGTTYHSSGVITGGEMKNFRNIGQSPEQIKKEIKELERKVDDLNQTKRNDEEEFQIRLNEYQNYTNNVYLLEKRKKENQENIFHLNELLQNTEITLKEMEVEKDRKLEILKTMSSQKESHRKSKITEITKKYINILKIFQQKEIILLLDQYKRFLEEENSFKETEKQLNYLEDSLLQNSVKQLKEALNREKKQLKEIQPKIQQSIQILSKIEDKFEESLTNLKQSASDLTKSKNEKNKLFSMKKKAAVDVSSAETMITDNQNNARKAKKSLKYLLIQFDSNETIDSIKQREFTSLSEALKISKSQQQRHNIILNYNEKINHMKELLESQPPNFHAQETYNELKKKVSEIDELLQYKRKEMVKAGSEFRKIKKERYNVFMNTFDVLVPSVQNIYSKLTSTSKQPLGGSAFLSPISHQCPFLDGITYSVLPPNKRLRQINALSGGEQTLAVVSLIFALNEAKPSPCFVLDEIDAALDKRNTAMLSTFLKTESAKRQIIIISHRVQIYSEADALVGICKDQKLQTSCSYIFNIKKLLEQEQEDILDDFEEPESFIHK